MKIAIVGCGATVYAGLFAAAGHELWAIDRWREHVAAIRARGLRLDPERPGRVRRPDHAAPQGDRGALARRAGLRVKVFDDIEQLVWEKLLCNCAYSGPCAVAGCTIEEVLNDPHLSRVSAACAEEGFELAMKKRIELDFADPVASTCASSAPRSRKHALPCCST